MKYSTALLATLASTALALPLVERQSKAAGSTADMVKGASEFSPKFLSGDVGGAAVALGQMLGGAASFTPGFFSDLGKAAGSVSKREAQMSTATSIEDMTKGAADFAPKFLAGDSKGVATALGQMLGGAASFTPGFFSDLGKAAGSVKEKREAQTPSSAASLADMTKGATDFAPKFLAGDAKGVTTALEQMLGGAASFTPGFFSDLAKASQGAAAAVPKPPTKE